MTSKTAIIFDVYGEYGHFRKFNTTTSPLTYSIPTPSAIFGLLGAVLGIEREDLVVHVHQGRDLGVFSHNDSTLHEAEGDTTPPTTGA